MKVLGHIKSGKEDERDCLYDLVNFYLNGLLNSHWLCISNCRTILFDFTICWCLGEVLKHDELTDLLLKNDILSILNDRIIKNTDKEEFIVWILIMYIYIYLLTFKKVFSILIMIIIEHNCEKKEGNEDYLKKFWNILISVALVWYYHFFFVCFVLSYLSLEEKWRRISIFIESFEKNNEKWQKTRIKKSDGGKWYISKFT